MRVPPQAKTSWAFISSKNLAVAGQQALFGCCYSLCERSPSLVTRHPRWLPFPKALTGCQPTSLACFCFIFNLSPQKQSYRHNQGSVCSMKGDAPWSIFTSGLWGRGREK